MFVNQAKKVLSVLLSDPGCPSAMLHGGPGIGKSAIVKQIADENGWGVVDLRLLLLNPVDLRGLPVPNRDKGRADWLQAGFLPDVERDGREGILLLDEINSAPPACQAAAYQIVLDRRCGDYVLPDGWRVVAAGNSVTDRGIIYQMPSPLANRMVHLDLAPSVDDWKTWALRAGIMPTLTSFLTFRQQLLYSFPGPAQEIRAFPSPRTWAFVDRILKLVDDNESDEAMTLVSGAVGEGAASELFAYIRTASRIPDAGAILGGEEVDCPESPDLLYALTGALVHAFCASPSLLSAKNLFAYFRKVPAEFQVICVKDIFKSGHKSSIVSAPGFTEWADENADVIGLAA